MKQTQLAIIGSGGIAQTHAAAIARLPEARLFGVCSRNLATAQALAAPSGAGVWTSLSELLAQPELDAVLIATPSGTHTEMALPALRAGKHVLCEKPLDISTDRVNQIITQAKASGALLAGFFPLRAGVGARSIRTALDGNRFGRLTFLSARVKWWREPEYYIGSTWRGTTEFDGGRALMNQGIHAVDLLQWLGGRVQEVAAYANTLAHPGLLVEDTLAASLRFAHGALGTIEASTSCYPGLDFSLEISGDRGTAILANDRIEYWRFADELSEDESIRHGQHGGDIQGGNSDPRAISCEGHRQQIAEFCRAIRGESADIIDGAEAGQSVSIVEAIYRSAQSGQSESLLTP